MLRPLIGLFVLLGVADSTHFRYGTISWKTTGVANEVEFLITLSWRRSYFSSSRYCTGEFHFGDGSGHVTTCITKTAESVVDDWLLGEIKIKHTYSATNNNGNAWIAAFKGCARISKLKVHADECWNVEAALDLDLASHSPIIQQLPMIFMYTNEKPEFIVAVADSLGRVPTITDTLAGSPITLSSSVGSTIVKVDTANNNIGWWPVQLRATFLGGYIPVDFIIVIKDPIKICTGSSSASCNRCSSDADCRSGSCKVNTNPTVAMDPQVCFQPGVESKFKVTATDSDKCQRLYIQNGGIPSGGTLGAEDAASSPVAREITWTPKEETDAIICFSSYDADGGSSPSTCTTLLVRPPPSSGTLTSFSPTKITKSGGSTIELIGSGMSSEGGGECIFGTKVVTARSVTDTKVVCDAPALAVGTYSLAYRVRPCGSAITFSDEIESTQTPVISYISPVTNKATNGFSTLTISLTITGNSFTVGGTATPKCKVGSTIYDAVNTGTDKMTCDVTVTSAGTYYVSASNDGVAFSNSRTFLVYELPALNSFKVGTDLAPSTGGVAVAIGLEFTTGSYCRLGDYYYEPRVVVSDKEIQCRLPATGQLGAPDTIADDRSTKVNFYICGKKSDSSSCSGSLEVTYYQNFPTGTAISSATGDGCTGNVDVTATNLNPMNGAALLCKFKATGGSYTVSGDRDGDKVSCKVPNTIVVGTYTVQLTNDGTYFSDTGPTFKVASEVPVLTSFQSRNNGRVSNVGGDQIVFKVTGVSAGTSVTIAMGGADSDGDGDDTGPTYAFSSKVETSGSSLVVKFTSKEIDIPVGGAGTLYLPIKMTAGGKESCTTVTARIYAECSGKFCPDEGVCDQQTGRCLPSPCGFPCQSCQRDFFNSGSETGPCGVCNLDTGKCECIDGWGDAACTSPTCTTEFGAKKCPFLVDCIPDPSTTGRNICPKPCELSTDRSSATFGQDICTGQNMKCNTDFFSYCLCDEGWMGYNCNLEVKDVPPPGPYVEPTCSEDNPQVCGDVFTTACSPSGKCARSCDVFSPCNSDSVCTDGGFFGRQYCKCNPGKIGLDCEVNFSDTQSTSESTSDAHMDTQVSILLLAYLGFFLASF